MRLLPTIIKLRRRLIPAISDSGDDGGRNPRYLARVGPHEGCIMSTSEQASLQPPQARFGPADISAFDLMPSAQCEFWRNRLDRVILTVLDRRSKLTTKSDLVGAILRQLGQRTKIPIGIADVFAAIERLIDTSLIRRTLIPGETGDMSPDPVLAITPDGRERLAYLQCPARHSPDFRSVHHSGRSYQFTAIQAKCIAILWQAWEKQTPDCGDDYLLDLVDSNLDDRRLVNLFRQHPAWGTVIVAGATRGTHRIAEPIFAEKF